MVDLPFVNFFEFFCNNLVMLIWWGHDGTSPWSRGIFRKTIFSKNTSWPWRCFHPRHNNQPDWGPALLVTPCLHCKHGVTNRIGPRRGWLLNHKSLTSRPCDDQKVLFQKILFDHSVNFNSFGFNNQTDWRPALFVQACSDYEHAFAKRAGLRSVWLLNPKDLKLTDHFLSCNEAQTKIDFCFS